MRLVADAYTDGGLVKKATFGFILCRGSRCNCTLFLLSLVLLPFLLDFFLGGSLLPVEILIHQQSYEFLCAVALILKDRVLEALRVLFTL